MRRKVRSNLTVAAVIVAFLLLSAADGQALPVQGRAAERDTPCAPAGEVSAVRRKRPRPRARRRHVRPVRLVSTRAVARRRSPAQRNRRQLPPCAEVRQARDVKEVAPAAGPFAHGLSGLLMPRFDASDVAEAVGSPQQTPRPPDRRQQAEYLRAVSRRSSPSWRADNGTASRSAVSDGGGRTAGASGVLACYPRDVVAVARPP